LFRGQSELFLQSVDHQNNRILACDSEAWRYLGWIVPEPGTGLPEWLPAETFGPLPVVTEPHVAEPRASASGSAGLAPPH